MGADLHWILYRLNNDGEREILKSYRRWVKSCRTRRKAIETGFSVVTGKKLKPGTINGYQGELRRFQAEAAEEKIELKLLAVAGFIGPRKNRDLDIEGLYLRQLLDSYIESAGKADEKQSVGWRFLHDRLMEYTEENARLTVENEHLKRRYLGEKSNQAAKVLQLIPGGKTD